MTGERKATPEWVGRAFGKGPLIGALIAGFMVWLPSHRVGTFIGTAIVMFIVIAGLRVADPYLAPVWTKLDRVPRVIRKVAGIGLPLWYSVSQFGPSASGHEVSTVRSTLIVTAIMAFALFHPPATADAKPGAPRA